MKAKKILAVYQRDLKSLIRNPVAIIIALGICILPALYAWINIRACWNPYDNTSQIPVAVVDLDEGAHLMNRFVNIGSEVENNLRKNHRIKWSFVGEKEADMGLVDGTYYAEIKIPKNFSSGFVSFMSHNPTRPQIIYKLNTKVNPVANKITDTAKNTLVDQISTSFLSTVNKTIFTYLNGVGENAEKNKRDIINFKNEILAINNNMDLITSSLQTVDERSQNLSQFLVQLQAVMPNADNGLDKILSANKENQKAVKSAKNTILSAMNSTELSLNTAKSEANRIQTTASNLNKTYSSMSSAQLDSAFSELNMQITTLSNSFNNLIEYLKAINQNHPNAQISQFTAHLMSAKNSLDTEKQRLALLQQETDKTGKLNQQLLSSIVSQSGNLVNDLSDITVQYNKKVRPQLNSITDGLYEAMGNANELISTAQGLSSQIDSMMKNATTGSSLAAKTAGDLRDKLLQYKEIISVLSGKLEQISNNDIAKIITVLQNNPAFMGQFLSSPFDLKEHVIYPIPNYGSAMSPIYTVLALWVGTLILASIFKTEPPEFEGSKQIGLREKFYGKMLTFLSFSILQAFIVTFGNKFILGVYTVSFPLMVTVAVVSAITFTMITFTLVALFGNVGKAISIIYLIIQIAGSGGSYPIQLDPLFFRVLQPLFPFTYSLEGLREAIGGPVIERVLVDFIALFIMQALSFIFGYFLRIPLYDRVHRFNKKFEEAGISE